MLRNRYVVGWNIFFPLVLATVFYFGFGNHIKWETLFNLLVCITFNSFGPIIGVLLFKASHAEK